MRLFDPFLKSAVIFLFCFSLPPLCRALAADNLESENKIPEMCSADLKSFCENEDSMKGKAKCLISNIEKLSSSCRQEMKRFARAVEQEKEQAGGALITPSALSSLTPPFTVIAIDGRRNSGKDPMSEGRFRISSPLKVTREDYLAFSLASGQIHFDEPVTLRNGTAVPETLDRAEVGLQYSQQLAGYRNWGLRASFGYAGDELFHNSKDSTFSIIANYGFPSSGGFWMWTLFFSNNSPLGNYIPIPGLMYLYKTPTLTGMLGFPATSLQWTPTVGQAYSISLLGLSATAEAAFGDMTAVQYFTTLKWTNQSFILSNRQNEKDRMSVEDKRAGIGVRSFLWSRLQADLEGGYAFDRVVYIGKGLRNMRGGSSDLADDWYFSFSLKAGF